MNGHPRETELALLASGDCGFFEGLRNKSPQTVG